MYGPFLSDRAIVSKQIPPQRGVGNVQETRVLVKENVIFRAFLRSAKQEGRVALSYIRECVTSFTG